jgi:hypothetical protein
MSHFSLVDFVDCIERYYIQIFPFLCCPSKSPSGKFGFMTRSLRQQAA